MLTYEDLKDKPKTLLAMTSLTRAEFDALLVPLRRRVGDRHRCQPEGPHPRWPTADY